MDAPVATAAGRRVGWVTAQAGVDDFGHDAGSDLTAPTGGGAVVRRAVQRVVVAVAVGEVADGLGGDGADELGVSGRDLDVESRPVEFEVGVVDRVGDGVLGGLVGAAHRRVLSCSAVINRRTSLGSTFIMALRGRASTTTATAGIM